jgi:hypothetical protein
MTDRNQSNSTYKLWKEVIGNNSTYTDNTGNHLSPQIIEHEKKPPYMTLEIQFLGSG